MDTFLIRKFICARYKAARATIYLFPSIMSQNIATWRRHHHGAIPAEKQRRLITWTVGRQGIYTNVSANVLEVCNYRPDELIGKIHFYELHPQKGERPSKP